MRIVIVWSVVWLLLYGSQAEAQGARLIGTARKGSESVASLLQQAGCHPFWLSKAVSDSGIKTNRWRHLPVGQRVILKVDACEPIPPQSVVARSKSLMRQGLQAKMKPKTAKPLESKEEVVVPPKPAEKENEKEKIPLPTPPPKPELNRLAWVMAVGGLFLGIVGTSLFFLLRGDTPASSRMSSSTSEKLGEGGAKRTGST